ERRAGHTQEEVQKRNLREEVEGREGRHFSSKNKSYNDDRYHRKGNHLQLEVQMLTIDVEVKSDDESDDEDEDDTLALMAELEQIRKERAEEKMKK
ncbi:hypothetical protein UlMin_003931, partial [Ulmus minor]